VRTFAGYCGRCGVAFGEGPVLPECPMCPMRDRLELLERVAEAARRLLFGRTRGSRAEEHLEAALSALDAEKGEPKP
jgi:hypothetical protein